MTHEDPSGYHEWAFIHQRYPVFRQCPAGSGLSPCRGYQVPLRWLKDRTGRKLSNAESTHFQKIVTAISQQFVIRRELDTYIESTELFAKKKHVQSAGRELPESVIIVG
jgi:hypothetical protein